MFVMTVEEVHSHSRNLKITIRTPLSLWFILNKHFTKGNTDQDKAAAPSQEAA